MTLAAVRPVIRPYTDADAEAVAALFNRYTDVPNPVAVPLTGDIVRRELAERGTEVFLVVEHDGTIEGTLGMFRGNGRWSVAADEVFGDMLFLSPRVRGGTLTGELFVTALRMLIPRGVEVLRLTANPANKQAFPLYRQLGCTLSGPPAPGEDGNVELVNHLLRLRTRIAETYGDRVPATARTGAVLRYLVGNTARQGLTDETETVAGRRVLRTEVVVADLAFRALLDPASGEVLFCALGAGPDPDRLPPPPEPLAPAAGLRHEAGTLRLELCERTGVAQLFHDGWTGPVLTLTWPEFGPPYSAGWRRNAPVPLRCTPLEDGWRVARDFATGTLTRDLRLAADRLDVRTRWHGDEPPAPTVRTVLVCGLRGAWLITGGEGGVGHRPAGRGLYPPDATEMAAAGHRMPPDGVLAWWEPGGGRSIRLAPDPSTCTTLVSDAVVHLDGPVDHTLDLRWTQADSPRKAVPGSLPVEDPSAHAVAVPSRPAAAPAGRTSPHPGQDCREPADADAAGQAPGWEPHMVAGKECRRVTSGGDTLILSAAAGGVVSWRSDRRPVITSPFPRHAAFACNPRRGAGIWVTRERPREDREYGVGWGTSTTDRTWHHMEGGLASPGIAWTVHPRVHSATPHVRLRVDGDPAEQDGETAIWLTPAAHRATRLLIPGPSGAVWSVGQEPPWQTWTDRLALCLTDGTWLTCAALTGDAPHILFRATRQGPLLALLTRDRADTRTGAEWVLGHLPDATAAVAFVSGANHPWENPT
ncbi:GNAT family N-acetyltransferase [Streptomyces sp. NPDC052040]|uniref:GNAT family N-acetyltransferase n=1 Tax=unclassified Streptomyces TaxID=2593676 RepID=UPI0037D95122